MRSDEPEIVSPFTEAERQREVRKAALSGSPKRSISASSVCVAMQLCLASIFAAIDPVVRPLRAQASASCSGRQHPAYDTALVPLHRVPQWQTRKPSHGALLPPVRSITFEEGE